jgi:exosortase/archaeosortase family protein
MKRFILLYLFYLLLLFGFLYMPVTPPALWLNDLQSTLTLKTLGHLLPSGQLQGIDIIINPHYRIIINQACNGMIPILFLWAAILAYPAAVAHKFVWLLVGYTVFSIVNILRILLVVYVVQQGGKADFFWIHDIVGNMLLMMTGLSLFYIFIKHSTKKTRKQTRPKSK